MSDYKQSANRRRNVRQATPVDAPTKGAAKKDTRRWCRGKVGVEHKLEYFVLESWSFVPQEERPRVLQCSSCGKQIEYWYPRQWAEPEPKPAWVTL